MVFILPLSSSLVCIVFLTNIYIADKIKATIRVPNNEIAGPFSIFDTVPVSDTSWILLKTRGVKFIMDVIATTGTKKYLYFLEKYIFSLGKTYMS